ncbi:hypothetical protein BH11PLA2_BH11PLA2_31130 [soil metagenome]
MTINSVPEITTAGRSCAAPVSLMDLYPTLNEVCGLDQKVPQKFAGNSLASLLNKTDQAWPYNTISSHDIGNVAITDLNYHYIRYADGSEELYDHRNDSREYVNLAKQPEMKPVKERLAAEIPSKWIPRPGKKGSKGADDE